MLKIYLAFFFNLLGFIGLAQVTLRGFVADAASEEPLPYAQVVLSSNNTMFTQTDAQGTFAFKQIPKGKYALQIILIGYSSLQDSIIINQNVRLNFKLQPAQTTLKTAEVTDTRADENNQLALRKIEGMAIYASKKSELINIKNLTANLSNNNARQAFARVPGVNVWESDAAGLQLGVGARGLSPDRTSNFNTRQNGYDIAADALGYPESYYAPPMQSLERIEIVRGAASLQYGTQFGGMINLKIKSGNPNKKIEVATMNTYNSVGHFNSFNEAGGQLKNTNYYAFYNHRSGTSFRENTQFYTNTGYVAIKHAFTNKFSLGAEVTHMNYLAQQAGGLTDVQFQQNPDQSFRTRNWFAVNWNLFSLNADYSFNAKTKLNTRTFGLVGSREALGNLNTPVRQDAEPFANRDLLADAYQNIGNETRLLHRYTLNKLPSAFLVGVRYYRGFTLKQQGFGSNGSSADFNFVTEDRGLLSDYSFPSENLAFFAENVFTLTEKLTITPGLRFENIATKAKGYYDSSVRIPLTGEVVIDSTTFEDRTRNRNILLAGIGVSYKLKQLEVYANFSQNYRAITFNNLRVVSPAFAVDENLQDEKGFNVDLGIRGSVKNYLSLDAGVFWLSYNNRIGSILTKVQNNLGETRVLRYTTNIADAQIFGFETYVELGLNPLMGLGKKWNWTLFNNLALIQAYYANSKENGVDGNQVEAVPAVNVKSGIRVAVKAFKAAVQFTYLSEQFSDATNAKSSGDGLVGIIPAYYVLDFSMQYSFKKFNFEGGVNNLTNNRYFTRRAVGYPGPGIIPSAPIHFYVGVGFTL